MVSHLEPAALSRSRSSIHLFLPASSIGVYPPLPDATEVDFSVLKEEVCFILCLIPEPSNLSVCCLWC